LCKVRRFVSDALKIFRRQDHMYRMISYLSCCATLALCAGCNSLAGVPQIEEVLLNPESLHPGDTVWLMVKIKDKNDVVARVEGTIVADPRAAFPLFDNGTNGDEKPNDGLWTLQVVIPPQLPPGEFELEFAAYRNDGLPVEVRTKERTIVPLKTSKKIVVEAVVVAP